MGADADTRIRDLCAEAVAADSQTDLDRIIPELRAALEEHIRLAKDSLGSQINTIVALDAASPTSEKIIPK